MARLTLAQDGQTEIVIKKSRFITTMRRVDSAEAAEAVVAEVRAANRKANHNVWAARIGWPVSVERASDDGEPSGTSGAPTLRGLTSHDLSNVVAVTTRYFGGVKLGASGLIRAYTSSVTTAIQTLGIVRLEAQTEILVTVDYATYEPLLNRLRLAELPVENSDFATGVTLHLFLTEEQTAAARDLITEATAGKAEFATGITRTAEVPVPVQ